MPTPEFTTRTDAPTPPSTPERRYSPVTGPDTRTPTTPPERSTPRPPTRPHTEVFPGAQTGGTDRTPPVSVPRQHNVKPGTHLYPNRNPEIKTIVRPQRTPAEVYGEDKNKPRTIKQIKTDVRNKYIEKTPPTAKPRRDRMHGHTHPKYKKTETEVPNGTGKGEVPPQILKRASGEKEVSEKVIYDIKTAPRGNRRPTRRNTRRRP